MSMIGVLQSLTEEQLEHIMADAKHIRYYLYVDENTPTESTSFGNASLERNPSNLISPNPSGLRWMTANRWI